MRKLVTLCFKHSVHTEVLLSQEELLYWGERGRWRWRGREVAQWTDLLPSPSPS